MLDRCDGTQLTLVTIKGMSATSASYSCAPGGDPRPPSCDLICGQSYPLTASLRGPVQLTSRDCCLARSFELLLSDLDPVHQTRVDDARAPLLPSLFGDKIAGRLGEPFCKEPATN
jgi:hypothetical protein